MHRHHEKRRDMARSILPSRYRVGPRAAIARAKRSNRRVVAQELALVTRPQNRADDSADRWDEWDEATDVGRYPDGDISYAVRWRRRGDKVEHFIRWAKAVTADLRPDDRLSTMRAVLPAGLIGDHAMSHLDWPPLGLRPLHDHELARWSPEVIAARDAARVARSALEMQVLRAVLRDVLEAPGGLRDLNAVMKQCDAPHGRAGCVEAGCRRRCLLGAHDVDAFLRDTMRRIPYSWRQPLSAGVDLPHRRFTAYLDGLAAVCSR